MMQYDMNLANYANWKLLIKIKDEETIDEFRKQVEKIYEIPAGSFFISSVNDNQMSTIINSSTKVKDVVCKSGVVLCH